MKDFLNNAPVAAVSNLAADTEPNWFRKLAKPAKTIRNLSKLDSGKQVLPSTKITVRPEMKPNMPLAETNLDQ